MTDAHERITLPPISSFDISPPGKRHTQFQAGPGSTFPRSELEDISPGPSRYDALESSHGRHIATGHVRRNHSPHSEPAVLVPPYESISIAPRPRSSSAALDRGAPVIPYPQLPSTSNGRRRLASYVSSREPSVDSQASFSRSPTDSPNARSRLQSGTVPSPHPSGSAATSNSGARLPSQMAAFINSTPGDTQDSKLAGMGPTRRRTSPARKRKASEMLGAASPGSEERAISPEPSESEAKKKYKKKMNVRHYRAQNKDAMTQLRDALPEHMRPPERQAKAYVTLSAIKYIRELTAENERLRAANVKQAKELADRHSNDPELSSSGKVAMAEDDGDGTVPKAEVPDESGK
ncbi:hypothetical protein BC826DRAFT_1184019 [Russula brevipes]|nr:hypothetical protein BC826DRAFT_1184019 [Russula brevipes]